MRYYLSVLFFLGFLKCLSSQQEISSYYPWANSIDLLEKSPDSDVVPILLQGKNYRIIKIGNFSGPYIKDITIVSRNAVISIYELPILRNGQNRLMLDLVNPLKKGDYFLSQKKTKYFLLEFKGLYPGTEKIKIDFTSAEFKKYSISQTILVSQKKREALNLNVWAYFDYSFLIKGLKSKVISDLQEKNVNTLIIPPGRLPIIGSITPESKKILSSYLNGTKGKFQNYVLYLGFNTNFSQIFDQSWQEYFLAWYRHVIEVFKLHGIEESKILFYPADEPDKENIKNLKYFKDFCEKNGLRNKLFVTVGKPEVFELLEFADIAQVFIGVPGTLEKLKKVKNIQSEIWLYDIKSNGLNYLASDMKKMGAKTFYMNGKGFGIWNYADSDKSVSENIRGNFAHSNRGSWEVDVKDGNRDYSMVYRKGERLYSSLRWEALGYSMDEFTFLKYYSKKVGLSLTHELIDKILTDRISARELELLKAKIF